MRKSTQYCLLLRISVLLHFCCCAISPTPVLLRSLHASAAGYRFTLSASHTVTARPEYLDSALNLFTGPVSGTPEPADGVERDRILLAAANMVVRRNPSRSGNTTAVVLSTSDYKGSLPTIGGASDDRNTALHASAGYRSSVSDLSPPLLSFLS